MFVVATAPAMHLALGLVVIKGESDRNELVLVKAVAIVAGHHHTGVAKFHL